jgi:Cu2+-containing amine oxidase
MAAHLLDPLSPTEYQKTAAVLRRDQDVTESWRFASIELKEPAKIDVKALGTRVMPWQGGPFRSSGTPKPTRRMRLSSI